MNVSGPFVLSDPDIVPIGDCPVDAIDYFEEVLERYPRCAKVGFGLKIDDLPDHYRLKHEVITIESYNWELALAPRLYEAPIDTTLALYRGPGDFCFTPAIRTGYPYLARHVTWYLDENQLPEEERFYRDHSSPDPWWSRDGLPGKLARLTKVRTHRSRVIGAVAPEPGREAAAIQSERAEAGQASAEARAEAMRVGREEATDPELVLAASAWNGEPDLVDETSYTAWAEPGWHSWNDMSPELEFCQLAAVLAQIIQPRTMIETGTGQGFLTRRVAEQLGPGRRLVCFEASPLWRQALSSVPFFRGSSSCALSPKDSPGPLDFASAELSVLDSGFARRSEELKRWWQSASPNALVLVHDTGNGHPAETPHAKLANLITELGIPGVFLRNPRGAFLGIKPSAPSG
jgi:hypothetical protein